MEETIKKYVNRPIMQLCFAVNNLEEAAHCWSETFGAGPFTPPMTMDFAKVVIHGVDTELHQSGCVGQWGPLQIELYLADDDSPNHIVPGANGLGRLHHVNCGFVEDMDAEIARFNSLGIPLVWDLTMSFPEDQRICMFDAREKIGAMIEVYAEGDVMRMAYQSVADSVSDWDRTSPFL
jgi:hypothetical protein